MNRVKQLVPLLVAALWVGFYAYRDYHFAPATTARLTADGWTLAASSANYVWPWHPWTLVRTPVTTLWFMRFHQAKRISPGVISVPELRVVYNYGPIESEENLSIYDLRNSRQTVVPPGTSAANIDLTQLKWFRPEPGTPGEHLMNYVRAKLATSPPTTGQ